MDRYFRRNITIDQAHDAAIFQRIADTEAAGYPTSYSGEIRRAIDEAAGNQRRIRNAIREDVNAITSHVQLLRETLKIPDGVGAVDAIAQAVERIARTVAPPASDAGLSEI